MTALRAITAAPSPGAPAAAPAYRTAAADLVADRARILALWQTGLQQAGKPHGKLDWYYGRNPEGLPATTFLTLEAQAVGQVALAPRRMSLDGLPVRTAVVIDFIVRPEHRTLFPSLTLMRAARREGLERFDVVYALPNRGATGVVPRAGYRLVGEIVRSARVLRSREYLSRYLPAWMAAPLGAVVDAARRLAGSAARLRAAGFTTSWCPEPDARFDDLWKRAAPAGVLVGVRDRAYLAWRFADCPLRRYEIFTLSCTDGTLAAYAVCLAEEQTMYVCDFLVDRSIPGAALRLWAELAGEAYARGERSLSVQFLGPRAVRREMEAAGLVPRESRKLYAAFADEGLPADAEHWYITRADDDTPGRSGD